MEQPSVSHLYHPHPPILPYPYFLDSPHPHGPPSPMSFSISLNFLLSLLNLLILVSYPLHANNNLINNIFPPRPVTYNLTLRAH